MSKIFTTIIFLFSKFNLNNIITIPTLSPLEKLISTKTMISTVSNEINEELLNENLFLQEVTNLHFNPHFDLFYIGLFATTFLNKHKMIHQLDNNNNKWNNIDLVSKISKKTKLFLFIILLILCKNVESVT